jgi:hypothetical protein
MAAKKENPQRLIREQKRAVDAFSVTAVVCQVKLTERQEGRINKMFPPYDNDMKKWWDFKKTVEAEGAEVLDHGPYGGLYYQADNEEKGREIAKKIFELLRPATQTAGKPKKR